MRFLTDKKIEGALRCPVCGSEMVVVQGCGVSLVCGGEKRHCYDFSSRGYVNFAPPGHTLGGDSKQAVSSRTAFLDLQYYRPVAEKLKDTVKKYCMPEDGIIIDAGCGEGYYSAIIAEDGYSVLGVDLSKFAVDAASKRAGMRNINNAFFGVAGVHKLPVADGSASAVVNVFAPCVEDEYFRVLKADGVLITVWAGKDHLMGLKKAVYDVAYGNDGREDLPSRSCLIDETEVKFTIKIDNNTDIRRLFEMTPYYWKTSRHDFNKLSAIDSLETEVDMMISVYRRDGVVAET